MFSTEPPVANEPTLDAIDHGVKKKSLKEKPLNLQNG
jgi:hypothetical protein